MTGGTTSDFDARFQLLTGNAPFPWQRALYERFISTRADNIPAVCCIPTGLGKTSILAIWLIARLAHPSRVPRRLIYVVNRRTVVDQTTIEAEKLRMNLPKLDAALRDLAISTLRGQFADNREWSMDPSRIAIVCGTVDMIGSRLLFSGYGTGFRTRPMHAGFLGQDSLLIHDEAHLEPAFQALLDAIQAEQVRCRDLLPLRVMQLSATARDRSDAFSLTAPDGQDSVVRQRIHAHKSLRFHAVEDEKKQLVERLADLAASHRDSQRAVLIFVRTVDDLAKVVAKLPEGSVRQLTGTMRGMEREAQISDPIFARFLPEAHGLKDSPPVTGTVYLACTSAGEVGVNLSADHLICDLTSLDSMVQRFGRVNRFGLRDDSRIDVVHPTAFKNADPLDRSRAATLRVLKCLQDGASPAAVGTLLSALSDDDRIAAFTPAPKIAPASSILFDAWALTTIRERLPGRPPVASYLHGVSEWQPAEVFVAWREEVRVLHRPFQSERDRKQFEHQATALLEDYPVKAHELLRDRASRVLAALKKLPTLPTTPVWMLDDMRVQVTTMATLLESSPEFLDGKILMLPPQAGGLRFADRGRSSGILDGAAKFEEAQAANYDVADRWYDDQARPLRLRKWNDASKPPGMKLVRVITLQRDDAADEEAAENWYWFVRHEVAETDARSYKEYPLQAHLDDTRVAAEAFVSRLLLAQDIRSAVILAAALHDVGKDRLRWQMDVGNKEYPAQKWAKSATRQAVAERSTYRHELGSLSDVRKLPAFTALAADAQDLTLHLIAAHHGRARPHFPVEEVLDDDHPDAVQALADEIPARFARLQRKYGRWGLAYLESLVRAADYEASRKALET